MIYSKICPYCQEEFKTKSAKAVKCRKSYCDDMYKQEWQSKLASPKEYIKNKNRAYRTATYARTRYTVVAICPGCRQKHTQQLQYPCSAKYLNCKRYPFCMDKYMEKWDEPEELSLHLQRRS